MTHKSKKGQLIAWAPAQAGVDAWRCDRRHPRFHAVTPLFAFHQAREVADYTRYMAAEAPHTISVVTGSSDGTSGVWLVAWQRTARREEGRITRDDGPGAA